MNVANKVKARIRRHARVRTKITGSEARPRLSVFRSARHIYGQLFDDLTGRTLVCASSQEPEMRDKKFASKCEAAKTVGQTLAARAKAVGISSVVFDRAGYLYHGRVKALADGAREGGLEF
jgi:large subunit ribosomal protein L18